MPTIHSLVIHCSQGIAIKYRWETRASEVRELQDSAPKWKRQKISTGSWLTSALPLSHTRHWGREYSSSGKSFEVHPTIPSLLTDAPTLWSMKATWDLGYEFST